MSGTVLKLGEMTLMNQLMFRFCRWVARGVVARMLRERNGGSGRLSYGPRPDHGTRTYAFFLFLLCRKYKSSSFASNLLRIVTSMGVSTWCNRAISAADVRVTKVSGALTNAVFFVSCPSISGTSTLLLRVYGPSSGSLISRPRELEILHVLSSKYKIGPLIYGTFDNGRIEQHFDSVALTAADLRDPETSRWVAARMAELHQVNVDDVEGPSPSGHEDRVKMNVHTWLPHAREVFSLPATPPSFSRAFNIDSFADRWEKYMCWISLVETREGGSRRVLAHNDAQYGNLLRMNPNPRNPNGHRQVISNA